MSRIAIVVGLLLWPSLTVAQSAQEMRSACRVLAEARVSDNTVKLLQDFDTGMCWGAFAAIQKAIMAVDASKVSEGPFFGVCAPERSTRTQLVSVFVEYARAHPERLHEDFFFVAVSALRDAFPCRQER